MSERIIRSGRGEWWKVFSAPRRTTGVGPRGLFKLIVTQQNFRQRRQTGRPTWRLYNNLRIKSRESLIWHILTLILYNSFYLIKHSF